MGAAAAEATCLNPIAAVFAVVALYSHGDDLCSTTEEWRIDAGMEIASWLVENGCGNW
jgi:hypothetical protein